MNIRKLAVVAVAALFLVPLGVAAEKFSDSDSERVIEGHTVFTVLENDVVKQGFDIVVLVREKAVGPNVLWFNDQFKTYFENNRYPCGGYVFATYSGVDPVLLGELGVPMVYVESYHITDPNGFVSDTDLYRFVSNGTGLLGKRIAIPFWITTVQNSGIADDGFSNCAPIADIPSADPCKADPTRARDPAENIVSPAGTVTTPYYDNVDGCPTRIYNADIFGLWRDVIPDGAAAHYAALVDTNGDGVPDLEVDSGSQASVRGNPSVSAIDGTGCEPGTEWSCGTTAVRGGEGNSHPYNPTDADTLDFDGDGVGDAVLASSVHVHETGLLDVFFYSDLALQAPGLWNQLLAADWTGSPGSYPPTNRYVVVNDVEVIESEIVPCDIKAGGWHEHCWDVVI